MDVTEFQNKAARTLIDKPGFEIPDKEIMVVWDVIGLMGESGEVADLVKKGIFHQHGLNIEKISEELGDVLWYVAATCTTLELDMSEIMKGCIEKLFIRYPNGYSSNDSIRRIDVKENKHEIDF